MITPKISHVRGPPHRISGLPGDTGQHEQPLFDEEDGGERFSSSTKENLDRKSQSLEAFLNDDDSPQHNHHQIIIEGKPGHLWLHRSSRPGDDDSLTTRSYHTGIHTLESVSSLLTETAHKIIDTSFRFGGRVSSVPNFGGTSSIPNEVFNLIKNLVGAGALGLPSGVAAFANGPSALIPATCCAYCHGRCVCLLFPANGKAM